MRNRVLKHPHSRHPKTKTENNIGFCPFDQQPGPIVLIAKLSGSSCPRPSIHGTTTCHIHGLWSTTSGHLFAPAINYIYIVHYTYVCRACRADFRNIAAGPRGRRTRRIDPRPCRRRVPFEWGKYFSPRNSPRAFISYRRVIFLQSTSDSFCSGN